MREGIGELRNTGENKQSCPVPLLRSGIKITFGDKKAHDRRGQPPDDPKDTADRIGHRNKEHADMIEHHSRDRYVFQLVPVQAVLAYRQ